MMPNTYPFNLIRAIYKDAADTHIDTIYLRGFYAQINQLTDVQQQAIRLRFESGYTFKQGAEQCGVPLEKFRQTISRALRKLRTRQSYFTGLPQRDHDRLNGRCEELQNENQLLADAVSRFTASGVNPAVMAKVSHIIKPEKLLTPVYEIGLSPRTLTGVLRMSISTVQDALLTPPDTFTNEMGFGKVSLNDLQNAIRVHLLDIPLERKK